MEVLEGAWRIKGSENYERNSKERTDRKAHTDVTSFDVPRAFLTVLMFKRFLKRIRNCIVWIFKNIKCGLFCFLFLFFILGL